MSPRAKALIKRIRALDASKADKLTNDIKAGTYDVPFVDALFIEVLADETSRYRTLTPTIEIYLNDNALGVIQKEWNQTLAHELAHAEYK